MKKHNLWHNLLIVGPPLVLIVVGLGLYLVVMRLVTPETKTISAVPITTESSDSASLTASSSAEPSSMPVNPILEEAKMPTASEVAEMQKKADAGQEGWRLDPVKAAEHFAGEYGFTPGDQLTMTGNQDQSKPTGEAIIIATHGADLYSLTLSQPKIQGEKGVWVLTAIQKQ